MEKNELIGTTFKNSDNSDNTIYVIDSIKDNKVIIKSLTTTRTAATYQLNDVLHYFYNGTWVKIINMKKYTIKELQEKSLRTLIHCTPEQAKKLGKYYYYKDEKKSISLEIWQADNCFQAYKELVVFIGYCSEYKCAGGWNNINHDYKPDIEFEQIIFPEDKEKILIGYKMIKPEFVKAACMIEGYISIGETIENGQTILFKSVLQTDRTKAFEKWKQAEVLDKWFEPVYELSKPKFEKIELGTPKRKFTIYKDKIEIITGNNEIEMFDNNHLSSLQNEFKRIGALKDFDIIISSVQIGCKYGVELRKEDLEKIKQIQNDL